MVYAIIPAAGMGRRMEESDTEPRGRGEADGGIRKQFRPLHGVPLLIHTLTAFQQSDQISRMILVVPQEDHAAAAALLSEYPINKIMRVCPGGATRQDSVQAGVAALTGEAAPEDIVLVHDGVRPFVSPMLIARVIAAAEQFGGAAAALPLSDSLARVSSAQFIETSLPRTGLWAMQTPQAFRYEILRAAFLQAESDDYQGTDETALVTRIGQPVYCVAGSPDNIKITTPADWAAAERQLRAQPAGPALGDS
jgi:2-C-methyl-D-erythritol 4-phosphate cytidylyltransferase